MKNKTWIIAWAICVIILSLLLFKKKEVPIQKTQQAETTKQIVQSPSDLWLLDPLKFCEQEVPIKRQLVYDRLQKQVLKAKNDYTPEIISKWRNSYAFFLIEEELSRRNLPSDLKYVPIIESGLISCKESGKQAKGWWQFIKSTAMEYLLEINDIIDQRCDLFASTEAAGNFLQDLKNQPNANWPDALAGYNMDQDTYYAAKFKQGAVDFYQVKGIPEETQEFVYKIIAIKLIMEYPEKYGYPKSLVYSTNSFKDWEIKKVPVNIKGEVSIDQIRQALQKRFPAWEKTQEDFKEDNSHILVNILPTGSYYFYVYIKPYGTS